MTEKDHDLETSEEFAEYVAALIAREGAFCVSLDSVGTLVKNLE